MAVHVVVCLFCFGLVRNAVSQLNEYTTEVNENGTEIWRSTSDFIPEYGQSFGNITIRPFMSAEFDFIWWGRTFWPSNATTLHENFFRVGFSGDISASCSGHASRYPSFWIAPSDTGDYMHVSVSDALSCSVGQQLLEYGEIMVGVEYHVKIDFNQTAVLVGIGLTQNDPLNFPEWWQGYDRDSGGTAAQWLGREAQVWWMSDEYPLEEAPYYYFNRGNGTFRNVVIMSSDSPLPPFATWPSTTTTTTTTSSIITEASMHVVYSSTIGFDLESTTATDTSTTVEVTNKPSLPEILQDNWLYLIIGGACFLCICCAICFIILFRRHNKIVKNKYATVTPDVAQQDATQLAIVQTANDETQDAADDSAQDALNSNNE